MEPPPRMLPARRDYRYGTSQDGCTRYEQTTVAQSPHFVVFENSVLTHTAEPSWTWKNGIYRVPALLSKLLMHASLTSSSSLVPLSSFSFLVAALLDEARHS